MIFDCIIFYNEFDLLELRLKELYDFVDYFIIVEGTHTFKGHTKENNFELNKDRYLPFLNKIKHFYLPNLININNAWEQEFKQRENIYHALKSLNAKDDDLIIFTDCDEIVKPDIIKLFRESNYQEFVDDKVIQLLMDNYCFNIETLRGTWFGGFICLFKTIENSFSERIHNLNWHFAKKRIGDSQHFIKDAGWHFSYFGGKDMIKNKIEHFAHQEYNNNKFTNETNIDNAIRSKKSLFSDETYTYIPFKDNKINLPKYIDIILKTQLN